MSESVVLVVEDDAALREALCETLRLEGIATEAAADGAAALRRLEAGGVGLVVSDVRMAPMDGETLLRRIRARWPELPVVMMTAYGTIEKAVAAMRAGASDYLVKPFDPAALVEAARRFLATDVPTRDGLVAEDPRTREIAALARRVARSDVTVLLTGESGTGKEAFARYIHAHSDRAEGPFVAINCAAIPENMLEAVLFGYEKGAFTGAYQAHPGKFEQAQGGTLLLDEISEMDLGLQAKLLRVLQEREVERLGGKRAIGLDVRVLATTNRNLREEVAAGRFREDLYYRINVFPLQLPPLRERTDDILPLARRFLRQHARPGEPVPRLSAEAEARLLAYSWPGNVRELDNVIQRALILRTGEEIGPGHLRFGEALGAGVGVPEDVAAPGEPAPAADAVEEGAAFAREMRLRERDLIVEAIRAAGSRKAAAERLGISPRTLRYKIARLREMGIEVP